MGHNLWVEDHNLRNRGVRILPNMTTLNCFSTNIIPSSVCLKTLLKTLLIIILQGVTIKPTCWGVVTPTF